MELTMKRKVCRALICLFLIHAVLVTSVFASDSSDATKLDLDGKVIKMIEPGQKATDFTIEDLNGDEFKLNDVIGEKVVFLFFWSIFCRPCQEEIPIVQEMYEKVGKENIAILAVSLDGDRRVPAIEKFVAKHNLNFTFLMDVFDDAEEGFIASDMYGVMGTPTAYIIDKKGVVTYNHTGNATLDDLMKKVADASK